MIMTTFLGGLCLTVHARIACQRLSQGSISLGQDVQNISVNNFPPLVLIAFKCLSGTCSISDTKTLAVLVSLDNVACVLIKVQARLSNDRASISGRQVCRSGDCVGYMFTKLCND
jgi:hypothetical protein